MTLIDTWNVETFDSALIADLSTNATLICDYLETSRQQSLEREASTRLSPFSENPHASDYMAMKERLTRLMESRTIRSWHYTRMTDAEVDEVRQNGVHLSTLETLRARLAMQVAAGLMTCEVAERLVADSPFQGDQHEARTGKFWMVSCPIVPTSSAVAPLLAHWGGEAAYFWQQDAALRALLAKIGRPRVLEIAMPLAVSRHCYRAAEAVVMTYAGMLGYHLGTCCFDLYSQSAIGPEAILAIHSESDESFSRLARGYPSEYIVMDSDRMIDHAGCEHTG